MKKIKLAFIFLLAQCVELLSCFWPLNNKRVVFFSSSNEHFNFNSKYLFLYALKQNLGLAPLFVINDKQRRQALTNCYGPHFISSVKLSGLIKIAQSKLWVSSVFENPYAHLPIPMFFNPRRRFYHIGHGIPLKNMVTGEKRISWLKRINRQLRVRQFTHVLAYSDTFKPIMKQLFNSKKIKFICLGQPRNDSLSTTNINLIKQQLARTYPPVSRSRRAVLYAPTWRLNKPTQFFPFSHLSPSELNNRLAETGTVLFLRRHPYFPAAIDPAFLKQPQIVDFSFEQYPEIADYLPYFDRLITDYSSIYLDFLGLNRPCAFIPYDRKSYEVRPGFTMNYDEVTPGPHIKTRDDFFQFICADTDEYAALRQTLATQLNIKPDGNCEENYRFLLSLRDE